MQTGPDGGCIPDSPQFYAVVAATDVSREVADEAGTFCT